MREEKDTKDDTILKTKEQKENAAFWRRIGIYGGLLLLAFLLGFLPIVAERARNGAAARRGAG